MKDGCGNCEAVGGAPAVTGKNREALSRASGMSATMGAIASKTRSPHHSGAAPYTYRGVSGYTSNENIKGYGS